MTGSRPYPFSAPPPRGFHLGEQLSALVDGQLDHDTRDRALGHVAECPDCLHALEAERRLKSQLLSLAAPPVPVDLTLRLLALPGSAPPAPPPRRLSLRRRERSSPPSRMPGSALSGSAPGMSAPPDAPPRTPQRRRPGSRDDFAGPRLRGARRRRGLTTVTGGLLTVAGVALGAAFVVSAPASAGGSVPSVASFTTEASGGAAARGARARVGESLRAGAGVRVSAASVRGRGFSAVLRPVEHEIADATTPVMVPADVPEPFPGGSGVPRQGFGSVSLPTGR